MKNYNEIQNITPEFLSMIKMPVEEGKILNYLMVMPSFAPNNNTQYGFPVGFASVSSALKASGRNVFTLNLNYKRHPLRYLKHAIIAGKIDVVLTGGTSFHFIEIKKVLDWAKEIKPDIITIVGGAVITADPKTAMTALENADYGVIGEGDITVNLLAYALETKGDAVNVCGIICLRNEEWFIRDDWPMIQNLDILPFPDYEGLEFSHMLERSESDNLFAEMSTSNYTIDFGTGRSCPYDCTFCFHPCGNLYRQMSLGVIKKHLDWLIFLYPIDFILFNDEILFSNIKTAIDFCNFIKPYNLGWSAFLRSDLASKEVLIKMKDSGCKTIFLGIESADNNILKSMNKRITIEQTERAIKYAIEIGLWVAGNLIFGDPEETTESFWRSINWWEVHRNKYAPIQLVHLRAYHGSQIYKDACKKGIIKDPVQFLKTDCPPINISKLSDDEYNILPSLFHTLQGLGSKINDALVRLLPNSTINISGRCPCCGNIVAYAKEYLFTNTSKPCHCCGEPLNINAIEYCNMEILNKNTVDLIKCHKIAVWAVNLVNYYWLTKAIPALKSENVFFVNNNMLTVPANGKHIRTLTGKDYSKKIFKPDIINEEGIEIVIVPNNPGVFEAIKRECKREYPRVRRVLHITELL